MGLNENPLTKGTIMPHCKTHKSQNRYNCPLCDQAIKSFVDKLFRRR